VIDSWEMGCNLALILHDHGDMGPSSVPMVVAFKASASVDHLVGYLEASLSKTTDSRGDDSLRYKARHSLVSDSCCSVMHHRLLILVI